MSSVKGFQGDVLEVEIVCPFCGAIHSIVVNEDDFNYFQNDVLVQDAFPYLTATEREELISGMCPDCQRKIFGE